jgi:hypothetical protein
MADITTSTIIAFVFAQIVSTIIIYIVVKLLGETEGIGTAVVAAIIGTIIYTIAYWLLGNGILAAIIAGFFWLLALKALYNIGWLKALLIAVILWIVTIVVGWFLPTLPGPF